MRTVLTLLGIAAIMAYSVVGAFLMNDWAVVAASGLPLDITIAEMAAANQPYSVIPGIIFAAIGGTLALAWGAMILHPRANLPGWASVTIWAGIVALGAPAYFFASFSNLNSVGDTFYDWDAEAAFALEAPLYVSSGVAALIAVTTLLVGAIRSVTRKRVPS